MGKHTRTQDQELGGIVTTYTKLHPSDLPNLRALRTVVRHFDRAMEDLGLDPNAHDVEANLVIGPGGHAAYKVAGWHLPAGPRG